MSARYVASDAARMELCHPRQGDWGEGRSSLADTLSLRSLLDTRSKMPRRLGGSGSLQLTDTAAQGAGRICWLRQHAYSVGLSSKVYFYCSLIFSYNAGNY